MLPALNSQPEERILNNCVVQQVYNLNYLEHNASYDYNCKEITWFYYMCDTISRTPKRKVQKLKFCVVIVLLYNVWTYISIIIMYYTSNILEISVYTNIY